MQIPAATAMIGPDASTFCQLAPASEPIDQKVKSRSCWSDEINTITPIAALTSAAMAMPASSMVRDLRLTAPRRNEIEYHGGEQRADERHELQIVDAGEGEKRRQHRASQDNDPGPRRGWRPQTPRQGRDRASGFAEQSLHDDAGYGKATADEDGKQGAGQADIEEDQLVARRDRIQWPATDQRCDEPRQRRVGCPGKQAPEGGDDEQSPQRPYSNAAQGCAITSRETGRRRSDGVQHQFTRSP